MNHTAAFSSGAQALCSARFGNGAKKKFAVPVTSPGRDSGRNDPGRNRGGMRTPRDRSASPQHRPSPPPIFFQTIEFLLDARRRGRAISGPGSSHGPGGSSSRQGQQAEAAGSGGSLIGAWRVLPNFKLARAGAGEVRFMNK
jgi:hypothetical protein